MKHILLIIVLVGTIISCKKDKIKKLDGINYPSEEIFYDVNNDGINDFKLEFSQTSSKDEPVSTSQIVGRFIELNGSFVLPHVGGPTFILTPGDSIMKPGEFVSLIEYDRIAITRDWDGERWDELWKVNSLQSGVNYLGYYLGEEVTDNLGWVKFDVNTDNAVMSIIDAKHSNNEFLIVE